MTTMIRAVFDGEVFRPKDHVDLKPNVEYIITVESDVSEMDDQPDEHPLTKFGRLATDMGVTNLSVDHDLYAHGRVADPDHGE